MSTRPAFQTAAVSLAGAALVCGGGLVVASRALPEASNREILLTAGMVAASVLPLAALFAPAAAWFGWDGGPEKTAAPARGPLAVALTVAVLATVAAWYLPDLLHRERVRLHLDRANARYEERVLARRDLGAFRLTVQTNPAALPGVLRDIATLENEFPFDTALIRFKADLGRESAKAKTPVAEKSANLLEERAVRLRNQGDWAGAAVAYRQMIELLPAEPLYAEERERLETALAAVLASEEDRSRPRSEKEMSEIRFREALLGLDAVIARKNPWTSYDALKVLLASWPRKEELATRLAKLEIELRREDLLPSEARSRAAEEAFPRLTGLSMRLTNGVLAASNWILTGESVLLEKATWTSSNGRVVAEWARLRQGVLSLKVAEKEPVRNVTDPAFERVEAALPLLLPELRSDLAWLGPFTLKEQGRIAEESLGQSGRWYRFAEALRLSLPLWLFAGACFWLALGWNGRDHLMSLSWILFAPIFALLLALLPLMWCWIAAAGWPFPATQHLAVAFAGAGVFFAGGMLFLVTARPT